MTKALFRVLIAAAGALGARHACAQQSDLLYVLQPDAIAFEQLVASPADWLVLEPSLFGDAASDFAPEQVRQLREDGPCRTRVLAYLSIGEAETYRDYFDPAWIDPNGAPIPGVAPAWLGPFNPSFPDNYKVRYWDPDWQAVILGAPGVSPLDRIVAQGFDGVYLDIIDAYYFWSAMNPELDRATARQEMIDFVTLIAQHARTTLGADGFLVFPQNGADIIRNDDGNLDALSAQYFDAISGIGVEDLFYDETSPADPGDRDYRLAQLSEYAGAGKAVLVTDYVIDQSAPGPGSNDARASDFHAQTRALGFVPYAAHADRDLNEIVSFGAPGWSVAQPDADCPPCSPADLQAPFGELDFSDVVAFLGAFAGADPAADLAPPMGVFDFSDVLAFLGLLNEGCPELR